MATIEPRTNEKDASLDSSDGRPVRAHDLDARRRAALAQADEATFSSVPLFLSLLPLIHHYRRWFHLKVCAVAGVGFFTDA